MLLQTETCTHVAVATLRRLLAPMSHGAAAVRPSEMPTWLRTAAVRSQGFHPAGSGAGGPVAAQGACTGGGAGPGAVPGRSPCSPAPSSGAAAAGGSAGLCGGGGGTRSSRRCAARAPAPSPTSCILRQRSYCATSRKLPCAATGALMDRRQPTLLSGHRPTSRRTQSAMPSRSSQKVCREATSAPRWACCTCRPSSD